MPNEPTPVDLINQLLAADGKPRSAFSPWTNRWQKYLFLSALGLLLVGAATGVAVKLGALPPTARWLVLGTLAAPQIAAMFYQVMVLVPELRKPAEPTKTTAAAVDHFNRDVELLTRQEGCTC